MKRYHPPDEENGPPGHVPLVDTDNQQYSDLNGASEQLQDDVKPSDVILPQVPNFSQISKEGFLEINIMQLDCGCCFG